MDTTEIRTGIREYADLSQQLNEALSTPEGQHIKALMDACDQKKKEIYDLAKKRAVADTTVEGDYQLVVAQRTTVDTPALFKAHGEAIARACPEAVTVDKTKFARAQKAIATLARKSVAQKEVLGISLDQYTGDVAYSPSIKEVVRR